MSGRVQVLSPGSLEVAGVRSRGPGHMEFKNKWALHAFSVKTGNTAIPMQSEPLCF